MHDWPASLPPLPIRGIVRTLQSNAIGFATEVGPGKQRGRSSARRIPHAVNFKLTRAQAVIFEAFFYGDLKGADTFSWRDPLTLAQATCRFPAGSPPTLTELSANRWLLSGTIEIVG